MKKYGFVGLAAMAMVLLTSLILPIRVQAGDLIITWSDRQTKTAITVEAGAQFCIGDFVEILSADTHTTAALTGAGYTSSDRKTATVNAKGLVKAKKEGLTEIRVQCKGKVLTCQLTVVKKKSIKKTEESKKLLAAAKRLKKKMPKKLTSKNAFAFVKEYRMFMNTYYNNSSDKLSYDGFLFENERPVPESQEDSRSEVLAVPEASGYWTANALVRQYLLDHDPTAADAKNGLKIKKVSVNSKTGKITVELQKKVTQEQILGAQLAFADINDIAGNKTKAGMRISVYDESKKVFYVGDLTLKKGAKSCVIQPRIYDGFQYKHVSLTEGHIYRLGSAKDWVGGMRAAAKAKETKKKK